MALNGTKPAFQLGGDGETSALCGPCPIRDSNSLVKEYMLLANYLLAQRLVTHARKWALLRHQPPPPLEGGMQEVVDVLRGGVRLHFDITSQTRKPCKNPWQGSQGVR